VGLTVNSGMALPSLFRRQHHSEISARTVNPDQTWKLSPQPQRPFSFGLVNVKPAVSALVS